MRFTPQGKIKFPKNKFIRTAQRGKKKDKPRIIEECFCPKGHSLIDEHVLFDEQPGIRIRVVKNKSEEGYLVLSPVYGNYSKVTLGIKLGQGDILEMYCPVCGEPLAVYTDCLVCNSQMFTLFTTGERTFSDCVGICQKVGCHNSRMVSGRRMLSSYAKTSCV